MVESGAPGLFRNGMPRVVVGSLAVGAGVGQANRGPARRPAPEAGAGVGLTLTVCFLGTGDSYPLHADRLVGRVYDALGGEEFVHGQPPASAVPRERGGGAADACSFQVFAPNQIVSEHCIQGKECAKQYSGQRKNGFLRWRWMRPPPPFIKPPSPSKKNSATLKLMPAKFSCFGSKSQMVIYIFMSDVQPCLC